MKVLIQYNFTSYTMFKFLIYFIIIVIAISGICHIEIPYKKTIIYGALLYVIIVDVITPIIKKRT